jgi:hypothetical protein
MKKNPWIAAVLNFFFFGAGYIYNGKRTGYGLVLLLGLIAIRYGEISIYLSDKVPTLWLILFIGLVTVQLGLAYDGYQEAKQLSESRA